MIIEIPGVGNVEFPDGTPSSVIEGALAQYKAAPPAPLAPVQKNPDGTYGTIPEGMVLNPATGQYTSRELLANNIPMNTATSAIAGAAQGSTFGLSDEGVGAAKALIPGKGSMGERYAFGREYARAGLDAARKDHPVAAYGGEVGGALIVPGGVAKSAGRAALAGGLQGLGYGFGTGEGGFVNRAENAAISGVIGAGLGAASTAVGKIIQKVADSRATNAAAGAIAKNAPSTEALRDMGSAAYKAVDDAGVSITPNAMKSAVDEIVTAMQAGGMDSTGGALSLTPKSARVAQLLSEAGDSPNPLPFSAVDQLRRKAGIAASDFGNKTEQQLGAKAISGLDDFINGLKPVDVASGDAEALGGQIQTARDIWSKMSRSQLLDDAIAAGDNYVSGTGSGIRLQFSRILKSPKLSRGFSDVELAAIRRVANGTIPERMLHLSGGGIGKAITTASGFAGGGLPGAAVGATGSAILGKLSDLSTKRSAEFARALVAGGGMAAKVQAPETKRIIAELLMQKLARPASPFFAAQAQGLLGQQ